MLLGQRLRGHQERGLGAGLDRLADGERRDDGLPRSHLPLQQPPHGPGAGEVEGDLAAGAPLLGGELERQRRQQRPGALAGRRAAAAPRGCAPRRRRTASSPSCSTISSSSTSRRRAEAGLLARAREVHRDQRVGRAADPQARPHGAPAGARPPRAPAAGRGRRARGCAAAAAARWPGRRGRAPGCGRPPSRPAEHLVAAHGHLAAAGLRDAPAQQQLVARREDAGEVILVEPDRRHAAAVVVHPGAHQAQVAPARALDRDLVEAHAHGCLLAGGRAPATGRASASKSS